MYAWPVDQAGIVLGIAHVAVTDYTPHRVWLRTTASSNIMLPAHDPDAKERPVV